VFFHGFHIDCGWFLTGEHRKYDSANGVLGAVKVDRPWIHCPSQHDRPHGWGAWELTARYAYLDFIDNDTPPGPSGQNVGIRLPQTTLGVNWYLNDNIRLMFNYNFDVPDESNTGTSEASTFSTRLGVWW
jgi:phosphate-selective porin OprO/OprP